MVLDDPWELLQQRDGQKTPAPPQELSKLVAIQQETHELQQAYDEVQSRLSEVRARNEQLATTLKEAQKVELRYNALQDDNDALQLSLQSSERLRFRQKALIRLMQQNGLSETVDKD